MRLVRLVYASRVAKSVDGAEVKKILKVSQDNNARDGISGMLCFNSQYFLQCLEGPRPAVNATYNRILGDPRHSEPELISFREIAERDFGEWSMGYTGEGLLARDTLFRFTPQGTLDPVSLSADSAYALLHALGKQIFKLQSD